MDNKRVFYNAAWIIGCKIIQSLLGLLITMFSARYLGPTGFGLINYAASVVSFSVPIMQLGLNSTLVHEIVNEPEREGQILGTALGMSFVSSIFCILGVVSFVSIANAGETTTIIVCALYSVQLTFQSLEMIQYWFQAKLLSKYVSITTLVAYGIVSIYKIVLLISESSIYWFAISQALDFCIISVTLLIIYHKVGTLKLSFSFALVRRLFSKSRYYIISSIMVTIFSQTDRIMLKIMVDEAAVGYYSAAVNCAGMTSFVFTAILDSIRPSILEKVKIGRNEFEDNMSRLYCIIIYLALFQSVVMTLFAKMIIEILYGTSYDPSISALRIVVWYTTFSYLGAARNIWILAEEKQKYLWIINLFGASANVVLNYILIPYLGVNGAALASLITQIFTNVIIGFIIRPIRYNNILMLRGLNPNVLINSLRNGIKLR